MTFKLFSSLNRQIWRTHNLAFTASFVLSVLFGLVLDARAQALSNSPNSPIHPFGQIFSTPHRTIDQLQRFVFYRTPESSSVPGAASIYVNGAYHASLVAGGYSVLCLPPGTSEVGVKSVQIDRPVKDNLDTITVIRGEGAQTQYLRVQEAQQGRQFLQLVLTPQALQEISGAHEQIHTISRVPQATDCTASPLPVVSPAPAASDAPAPASQSITLAADALFAFGRSDLSAISPLGRASLDSLLTRLRNEFIQIERLNITGHADPLGQPELNERLSLERAHTIADYLRQSGLC